MIDQHKDLFNPLLRQKNKLPLQQGDTVYVYERLGAAVQSVGKTSPPPPSKNNGLTHHETSSCPAISPTA